MGLLSHLWQQDPTKVCEDPFCKTIQIGEITIDFSEISELYAM